MNPIDEQTLQAYVDGELAAADAARIDAQLVQDPALALRVQQARAVRARLQAAFDPVLSEPVPEKLSALLQPAIPQTRPQTPPPASPSHRHESRPSRRHGVRRWWVPTTAVAASIAVLALALWWRPGNELVRMQDGQRVAAGVLSDALDRSLASQPEAGARVAIGLTFRADDGHICRSFVHPARPALAGLACHQDNGAWSLPVLGKAVQAEGGELRQAASDLPPEVQKAIDARIRGDVFDAQQEREARAAGWH